MKYACLLGPLVAAPFLLRAAPALANDPTTSDCIAAAESSTKLRAEHKLRAARQELLVCAARSCPHDVRAECLRRIDEVNTSIPTVVFETKDAAGNDLPGVSVTMDGEPLSGRLEGLAISLDPGEHRFVFRAPEGAVVEKILLLHESEKDRHERIVLGSAAPPPPAPRADASGPQGAESHGLWHDAPVAEPRPWQRTAGLAIGGVGVASIAAGGVLGLVAMSRWSQSQKECGASACPDRAAATADHDGATTDATVSTAAFVAGGVLFAAGAVLFLTSPAKSPIGTTGWLVSPVVGPGVGAVAVWSRF